MNTTMLLAQVSSIQAVNVTYPCCKKCNSKVCKEGFNIERWSCKKCGSLYATNDLFYKYRVCLTINDGLTQSDVTVIGDNLDPFFGLTANQFERMIGVFEESVSPAIHLDMMLEEALYHVFVGNYFYFVFKTNKLKLPNAVLQTNTPIPLSKIFEFANLKDKQYIEGIQGRPIAFPALVAWQMQAASNMTLAQSVSQYLRYLVCGMRKSDRESETVNLALSCNLTGLLVTPDELYQNEIDRNLAHTSGIVSSIYSNMDRLSISTYVDGYSSAQIQSGMKTDTLHSDNTLLNKAEEDQLCVQSRRDIIAQNCDCLEEAHIGAIEFEPCGDDTRDSLGNLAEVSFENKLSVAWFQAPNVDHVNRTRGGSIMASPSTDKSQNCVKLESIFDLTLDKSAILGLGIDEPSDGLKKKCTHSESSLSEMHKANSITQSIQPVKMNHGEPRGSNSVSTLSLDNCYSAHLSQLFQQMLNSSIAVQRNSQVISKLNIFDLTQTSGKNPYCAVATLKKKADCRTAIGSNNNTDLKGYPVESDRNSENLFGSLCEDEASMDIQQILKLCPPTPSIQIPAFDQVVFDVTSSEELSLKKSLDITEIYLDHYKIAGRNEESHADGISALLFQSRLADFSMSQSQNLSENICDTDCKLSTTPDVIICAPEFNVSHAWYNLTRIQHQNRGVHHCTSTPASIEEQEIVHNHQCTQPLQNASNNTLPLGVHQSEARNIKKSATYGRGKELAESHLPDKVVLPLTSSHPKHAIDPLVGNHRTQVVFSPKIISVQGQPHVTLFPSDIITFIGSPKRDQRVSKHASDSCDLFEGSQNLFDSEGELSHNIQFKLLTTPDHELPAAKTLAADGTVQFSSRNERVCAIDLKKKCTPTPSGERNPLPPGLRKSTLITSALRALMNDNQNIISQREYRPTFNEDDSIDSSHDLFSDSDSFDDTLFLKSSTPNFKTIRKFQELSSPIPKVNSIKEIDAIARTHVAERSVIANNSEFSKDNNVEYLYGKEISGSSLSSPDIIAGTPVTRSTHLMKPYLNPKGLLVFCQNKSSLLDYQTFKMHDSAIINQSSVQYSDSANLFSYLDSSSDLESLSM